MQPVVHPVVGYLCYAAYTRLRDGSRPAGEPTVVAVWAAVLPDLIDQPLYLAGITPVRRTVAHSLFGAVICCTAVGLLARRAGRQDLAVAFGVGYGSHLLADIPWHVLAGDFHELGFLFWPLTEMPPYSGVKHIGTVGGIEITTLWFEAVLFVIGFLIWWADGRPGVAVLRQYFSPNRPE